MKLSSRVARLEQSFKAVTASLIMRDGRRVQVSDVNILDCLVAAMHGEEHPLLPTVRDATREEGSGKILGLIQRFDCDDHRQMMAAARGGGPHALQGSC